MQYVKSFVQDDGLCLDPTKYFDQGPFLLQSFLTDIINNYISRTLFLSGKLHLGYGCPCGSGGTGPFPASAFNFNILSACSCAAAT